MKRVLFSLLAASFSCALVAQDRGNLKKHIQANDMSAAFRSFAASRGGSTVKGPKQINFRASLLERIGLYHLAIAERGLLAKQRVIVKNDGKLGNLSMLLSHYDSVLALGASRVSRAPTELKLSYSLGRLNEGQLNEAARSLPANSALGSLSHSAPAYKGRIGAAGVHLARGRYEAAMNILGAEFQNVINFDLGLVRLQRARLLFDARKYADALDELLYLPKTSSSWYHGQMVGAWSAYYLKDYNLALGILMNVHSPYLAKKYNPESFLLESAVLFRLCYYESAIRSLAKLRKRYGTLPQSILRFQSYAKSPTRLMNVLSGYARGRTLSQRGIGQNDWNLINDALLSEEVIADVDRGLQLVAQEKAWVEQNLSSGQFSRLKARYLRVLNNANKSYYNRAARFADRFLRKMGYETQDALEGALAVDVEINTRIRDRLLTGKTPQRKEIDFDREVKKGFEFWPFEGEFWRDETGSYAFVTSNVCEGRR